MVTEILDRPKWAMMESSAPDSLEGKNAGNGPYDDLQVEKNAETATRKGTWEAAETVTEGNPACFAATSTERENRDVAVEHWKPETDANASDADTEVGPKKGRGRPQARIRGGSTPGDDPTGSAEWLISSWEEDELGREEVRRGKVPKGKCFGGVCADAGDKLEEGDGSVLTKSDGTDDGCTRTTPGSSLQLRDGGCAPGEEGCGRDEDL